MASRPITPSHDAYPTHLHDDTSLPHRPPVSSSKPNSYLGSGLPGTSVNHDNTSGAPPESSLLAQSTQYENEGLDKDYQHTSTAVDHGAVPELHRSESQMSQTQTPSRGGTLKKKASLKRTGSLMRSNSKRSSQAGSVRSVTLGEKEKFGQTEEMNSVFYCPVPTSGNPTDLLANRFQCMLFPLQFVHSHWTILIPALIVYSVEESPQRSYHVLS